MVSFTVKKLILLFSVCLPFMNLCMEVNAEAKQMVQLSASKEQIEQLNNLEDSIYEQNLLDISDRKDELSKGSITIDNATMKLYFEKIGQPDENGYPLYIALRGGGVGDKSVAEEQFSAMKDFYNVFIPSGIYVAPKCLIAYYDEHYRPESFIFYDRIIEDAIAFYNVDPNRIYIVGFSSGGDGVYVAAPHLADRFAAANMSAGYPHEHRIGNMYNLPICLQVGENDTAYDRNTEAAKFDDALNTAAQKYGGGFPHQTFIHVDGTHNENWDDYRSDPQKVYTGDQVSVWLKKGRSAADITEINTSAIDWMSKYERDPLPSKVVWQTDVGASLRKTQAFYWFDRNGDLAHSSIVASYSKDNNEVKIEHYEGGKGILKVYLNQYMMDVFSTVTLDVLGKKYSVQPVISEKIMRSTLYARGDRNYMFTSEIDIVFGDDGKPMSVKAVEEANDSYECNDKQNFTWSENGLFYVRNELFGLSFNDLRKETGLNLPTTKPWKDEIYPEYKQWVVEGNSRFYMTSIEVKKGKKVFFLFQKGKCVAIYCESAGKASKELSEDYNEHLGELVNGLSCKMNIENIYHDSKFYNRQLYKWYLLEEWNNMYETLKL